MRNKKPFKFYSHNFFPLKLLSEKKNGSATFLSKIGRAVFEVCFFAGNIIYKTGKKTAGTLVHQFKLTGSYAVKRFKILRQPTFVRSLLVFLAVCLMGAAGIEILSLGARALDIKQQVVDQTQIGQAYLLSAQQDLEAKNLAGAQNEFLKAYNSFQTGSSQLQDASNQFYNLLDLLPQKQDADKVLEAAQLIAKTGSQAVSLANSLGTLNISPAGISASGGNAQAITSIGNQINTIQGGLNAAADDINSVNQGDIPASEQQTFVQTKQKLQNLQQAFGDVSKIYSLLQSLLLGQKNVLVLFENSNELRPGGGFIGTYGNFKIDDGTVENLKISSIYDLDGQLTQKIMPPDPVLAVNDRWYLRDSNWFADFPADAKTASDFYELEGGETPDVVVVITSNFVVDLLKATGPVNLPNYNLTLNSDNFIEQMQAASTVDTDGQNNPKQILADFYTLLMQKLSATTPAEAPGLLTALQNGLNEKNLMIYSRLPDLQQQLEQFNWSGEVLNSDRDYLNIVSANLGGTKTDNYIKQSDSLETTINPDGSITDHLTITRTNSLPDLNDDMTNTSFIRIMVPQGSTLLDESGFDFKDLQHPDPSGYQTNADVQTWEQNSSANSGTGTITGSESGKTYFANWQILKGGESKTVTLDYKLPFTLADIDRYSLMIQKQPGALDYALDYKVNFSGRNIEWADFNEGNLTGTSFENNLTVNGDSLLGEVLNKNGN